MATPLAEVVEPPVYEMYLRNQLRQAYAERVHTAGGTLGPQELADVAMAVLGREVDTAMAWGVDCAACAHYLDLAQTQHTIGERAGVELFRKHLDRALKDAALWVEEGHRVEHITTAIAGFLRAYHNDGAGQTFTTPPPPETGAGPSLPT